MRSGIAVLFVSACGCTLFGAEPELVSDAGEDPLRDVVEAGIASPGDDQPDADGGYEALILSREPVGYWRFDETATPTAFDSSGNDRHGTFLGVPTFGVPGAFDEGGNTAVEFSGEAHVRVENVVTFAGREQFTLEAWVRPSAMPSGAIAGHGDFDEQAGYTGYRLSLSVDSSDAPLTLRAGRGSDSGAAKGGDVAAGEWHHIAMIYDGVNVIAYLDRALIADSTSETDMPEPATPFTLAHATKWGHFAGAIDEVALYDRALTVQELAEHYDLATR